MIRRSIAPAALALALLGAWAGRSALRAAEAGPRIELTIAHDGYDRNFPWCNSHLGFVPAGNGRTAAAVLLTQKAVLADSDNYLGLSMMESRDDGRTWSGPLEQPSLRRQPKPGGIQSSLCDFALQWSPAAGKLWGIGGLVDYRGGDQVEVAAAYALFDAKADSWGPEEVLALPASLRFRTAIVGNGQWVETEGGDIFLPIYGQRLPAAQLNANSSYSSLVLRCRFENGRLRALAAGNEMSLPFGRGFCEPGLTRFQGRYLLTLRNDLRGYVTVSADGLSYPTPRPWRFDDGSELGSYNTQQRWLQVGGRIFLVYTRRGLDNDHVFRNRAPLLLGEVDPRRLCIRRSTEQVLIPDKGAELGAWLSVAQRSESQAWVCATEDMENGGPSGQVMLEKLSRRLPARRVEELGANPRLSEAVEQFGSNGRIYVVKVSSP